MTTACLKEETAGNTGSPDGARREREPDLREEQAGPFGVAEGPVRVMRPGNAGGAKGPWVKDSVREAAKAEEIGSMSLPTLQKVEKLRKTHLCRVPGEPFDFPGYTIGRCYSTRTGKSYIGTRPAKKRVISLCREISVVTSRRWMLQPAEEKAAEINRKLIGWSNYFSLGPVSKAYRAVDRHVCSRMRRWLCRKHKVGSRGASRYPDEYLYRKLGLVRLPELTRNFSWAKT